MSEMVDRVAAAVLDVIKAKFGMSICNISDEIGAAAIKAMLEPTEAMLIAAMMAQYHNPRSEWKTLELRREWQTMIEAALK